MKNILLTGLPSTGKTTLIRRLCEIFKEFNPSGFYTSEILKDGVRVGFEVVSLQGDSRVFSHVNLKSKYAVGKYKVDVKGFEDFISGIFTREKKTGFFFIDEIGKMECESKKFCRLVVELLNSDKPVVATIAEKAPGLPSEIKKRSDVKIFQITPSNRDLKLKELTMEIRDILLD